MPTRIHTLLPALLAVLLVSALAFGQAGRAELMGAVEDPSGLAVPKATVEAEDQATRARYATTTDERGEYHLLGLPAGRFVLLVTQSGFQTYRQSGINLRLGDRTAIDVRLSVGQSSQSIQVTAAAPMLKPRAARSARTSKQTRLRTCRWTGVISSHW